MELAMTLDRGPVESSCTVDHLDQIVKEFSQLYWREDFSDVELVINETVRLKAHRAVLALSSDVFCQMFSEGRWQESGQREVALTEEESCVEHMDAFLQYFYTGTLTIHSGNLFPLLVLSDKYNVQELRRSCERFALRSVCAGPVDQALSWWRSAEQVGFLELAQACQRFVTLNVAVLAASSDWLSLQPEQLLLLLENDDLRVESEFQLFRAIRRWLSINEPEGGAGKILEHVRFPLMSPLDVYDPALAEALPENMRDTFLAESSLIYQVNSLPIEAICLYQDIQLPKFTMRLYTSADFGCFRNIQNIDSNESHCIDFTTKIFQSKTTWKITSQCYQNRSYGHSGVPLLKQNWTCRIDECNLTDGNHDHQLIVLMYRNVAGTWLACDYETFSIPHKQDVPLGPLFEMFEKKKCVHKNTIFVHFIGKIRWGKFLQLLTKT
ncbi:hypothetical protein JZ751_008579 [Albula glossodonta]|uniref:BTB domain-containing protein n=1 Tax=Albula glossodonta TaxID=121402 RepID=A0A8T2NYL1_9TELE|nr:hypothetical protein JZ751_008579 [Albula glossodonta]